MTEEKLLLLQIKRLTIKQHCYSDLYFKLRDYLYSKGISYEEIDKIAYPYGDIRKQIRRAESSFTKE